MNITDHIVALLKSGKDVEMNGIGAFVVKTIDAYMDESTKTFYPKRQTVEFHPYTEDRGNIAELIARKECVDESTAQRMWKNYYDALQDKLQTQHSHTFPELGDLKFEDGNYSFAPIEGLNLLGNSEELQPVVGVDTFETNPNEDPFAVFDNPETVVPEPETAPEEPETPAVDETPADEEQPAEQPADEPEPEVIPVVIPVTEQPEENIEQQPETAPEPEPVEDATKEPEPVPSPAPAEEEKPEQVVENNQVADKPADDLQTILDDEPDAPVETTKTTNRRGTRTLIILLIVLLLLLWAGAACYYFFVFKKNNTKPADGDKPAVEQTDTKASQASQLKSDENTVQPETTAEPEEVTATEPEAEPASAPAVEPEKEVAQAEPATDASTDNGSLNAVASDYDYNKFNSSFAFDLSNVEVTAPDAVATNKNMILKRLSGRIERFVKGKQYSTAAEKLKGKIGQFIEERLGDKFNTQTFNVTNLMPYTTDNFVRQYVGDELQTRKQRRVRYEVIEEIFANNMLGQYLDELINAGEVSKDVVKAPAAPVYTAPVYTAPKAGFDVIAGTYRDKQSAMRMASSLRSKGAGAYVIEKGGLYYVSAGSAPSRTAADKVMYQLKTWYTSNLSIKQW